MDTGQQPATALARWLDEAGRAFERDGRRHAAAVLANSAGISPELLERIAAGDVEPAHEIAVRLHLSTGGKVPVSSWLGLSAVPEGCELHAVGHNGPNGWVVAVLLGGSVLGSMRPSGARAFAQQLNRVSDVVDCARQPGKVVR